MPGVGEAVDMVRQRSDGDYSSLGAVTSNAGLLGSDAAHAERWFSLYGGLSVCPADEVAARGVDLSHPSRAIS